MLPRRLHLLHLEHGTGVGISLLVDQGGHLHPHLVMHFADLLVLSLDTRQLQGNWKVRFPHQTLQLLLPVGDLQASLNK